MTAILDGWLEHSFMNSQMKSQVQHFKPLLIHLQALNEIENEAFFAMLEYDVSDNLSLSAEGRFYDEEKSFADNNLKPISVF